MTRSKTRSFHNKWDSLRQGYGKLSPSPMAKNSNINLHNWGRKIIGAKKLFWCAIKKIKAPTNNLKPEILLAQVGTSPQMKELDFSESIIFWHIQPSGEAYDCQTQEYRDRYKHIINSCLLILMHY